MLRRCFFPASLACLEISCAIASSLHGTDAAPLWQAVLLLVEDLPQANLPLTRISTCMIVGLLFLLQSLAESQRYYAHSYPWLKQKCCCCRSPTMTSVLDSGAPTPATSPKLFGKVLLRLAVPMRQVAGCTSASTLRSVETSLATSHRTSFLPLPEQSAHPVLPSPERHARIDQQCCWHLLQKPRTWPCSPPSPAIKN